MIKLLMILVLLLNLSANVFANEKGNGGATIICKDSQGKITSVKLLDIYTWEIIEGLNFDKAYDNENAVIEVARKRLIEVGSMNFLKRFSDEHLSLNQNWVLLPTGTSVVQANDAEVIMVPPTGCDPYYIVNYRLINDRPRILVNRDIFNNELFSTLQKGALKVHEIVYAAARKEWLDVTPTRAQEITALLTADVLSENQYKRLRELTKSTLYLDLNGIKLTAKKSFTLEARSAGRVNPRFSSTTRLQNGRAFEMKWGNWPHEKIWYYYSVSNDSVYEIKKGDVFVVPEKIFNTEKLKLKRVSDSSEFTLGLENGEFNVSEIEELDLFQIDYP